MCAHTYTYPHTYTHIYAYIKSLSGKGYVKAQPHANFQNHGMEGGSIPHHHPSKTKNKKAIKEHLTFEYC